MHKQAMPKRCHSTPSTLSHARTRVLWDYVLHKRPFPPVSACGGSWWWQQHMLQAIRLGRGFAPAIAPRQQQLLVHDRVQAWGQQLVHLHTSNKTQQSATQAVKAVRQLAQALATPPPPQPTPGQRGKDCQGILVSSSALRRKNSYPWSNASRTPWSRHPQPQPLWVDLI